MRAFALLLAPVLASPALAQSKLPPSLDCRLIGIGGCGEDGICVGGGRRDPSLRLRIDTVTGRLSLNGITGQLVGDEKLNMPGEHEIHWSAGLIGLNYVRVSRPWEDIFVILTDHRRQAEFRCIAR